MRTDRLNPGKAVLCGGKERNVKFEVKLENETMRLNLNDMAHLFSTDSRTVRGHVRKIFKEEAAKRRAAGKGSTSARARGGAGLSGSLFPSLCIKLLRGLPPRPHCDDSLPA